MKYLFLSLDWHGCLAIHISNCINSCAWRKLMKENYQKIFTKFDVAERKYGGRLYWTKYGKWSESTCFENQYWKSELSHGLVYRPLVPRINIPIIPTSSHTYNLEKNLLTITPLIGKCSQTKLGFSKYQAMKIIGFLLLVKQN